jgi:hypothetical protein
MNPARAAIALVLFATSAGVLGCRHDEAQPHAGGASTSAPAPVRRPPPNPNPAPLHASEAPMDKSVFERDQPRTGGVVAWNDGVVVPARPSFYSVDVDRGSASRLALPGCAELEGVATQATQDAQERRAFALCKSASADAFVLLRGEGARWIEERVPPGLLGSDGAFVVATETDSDLVIWEPSRGIHRRAGTAWSTTAAIGVPATYARRSPAHALVWRGRLYLGYAAGEWGGVLASLDLATATWRNEGDSNDPVTGLAVDPAGHLWAARGQSHLGRAFGALDRLDGDRWKRIATSPGKWGPSDAGALGWALPNTSFDGLAFDDSGRPVLATGSLGLVAIDVRAPAFRLTPRWPEFVYVTGLVMRGSTAVIATFDGGLLLVDLSGKNAPMRRVTLPR